MRALSSLKRGSAKIRLRDVLKELRVQSHLVVRRQRRRVERHQARLLLFYQLLNTEASLEDIFKLGVILGGGDENGERI